MTRRPTSALLEQSIQASYPLIAREEGVYNYDSDGREYLDVASGAMTASIGHGAAEVADAFREHATTIAFSYRTQFTNGPAKRLASLLTSHAPGNLDYAFFVNSGSEAAE